MSEDELRALIRSLIALGVGLEVLPSGQPNLLTPPIAEAMVRSNLDVIRGQREAVVRLWRELAVEGPPPKRCRECAATVYRPGEARGSAWAFCEFRFCPFRMDPRALDFRASEYQQQKLAEGRAAYRRALGLDDEPIPE